MGWSRYDDIAYMRVDDLKDGYAYQICGRRANVGIWVESRGTFVIPRRKFGTTYLFEEVHWDIDESFGTAKPLKEIERAPFKVEKYNRLDQDILNYLIGLDELITGEKWNYESNDNFPL
ncbi:MAG TPA: hypothetical protein VN328_09735 [Thermodesulfovibrionales bacterium]|nr:hypothetical protein [Thermodesulfovibrionales bacterium]